jgi:hypothetical protein
LVTHSLSEHITLLLRIELIVHQSHATTILLMKN